jgi:hypothetical protein
VDSGSCLHVILKTRSFRYLWRHSHTDSVRFQVQLHSTARGYKLPANSNTLRYLVLESKSLSNVCGTTHRLRLKAPRFGHRMSPFLLSTWRNTHIHSPKHGRFL